MYKKLTLLSILSCGLLISCDSTIVESSVPPGVTTYRLPISIGDAYEFRLTDGTRCVAVYKGGLACNWKTQP